MDAQNLFVPGVKTRKTVSPRKLKFAQKLKRLLRDYDTCLIVSIDNVKSSQIDYLRKKLRGKAIFLFGKNTLIRKIIREYMKETGNRKLMTLLDLVKGNGGFVFTKHDIGELRKEILQHKVSYYAKAGSIAPVDVYIPSGKTGISPTETTLFQSLNIATKIQNTQINILNEKKLINKGSIVGINESLLLKKLNIKPFFYGIKVSGVYSDGENLECYCPCLTSEDIEECFFIGLRNIASLCLRINYPIIVTVPYSILFAYKKVLSLGLSFNKYNWNNLKYIKNILENPQQFANISEGYNNEVVLEEPTESHSSEEGPINLFGDYSSSEESSEDESE